MLKIEHGTKSFGTQNIFTDISLTIDHPGLFALWGESGSGKSTLLNALIADADAETGNISEKTGRGKHTTRHVEIFPLDHATYVYDTPILPRTPMP